eukprot:scaffold1459_cov260-Pinguiococcus_pyrenoidosus.AAC.19
MKRPGGSKEYSKRHRSVEHVSAARDEERAVVAVATGARVPPLRSGQRRRPVAQRHVQRRCAPGDRQDAWALCPKHPRPRERRQLPQAASRRILSEVDGPLAVYGAPKSRRGGDHPRRLEGGGAAELPRQREHAIHGGGDRGQCPEASLARAGRAQGLGGASAELEQAPEGLRAGGRPLRPHAWSDSGRQPPGTGRVHLQQPIRRRQPAREAPEHVRQDGPGLGRCAGGNWSRRGLGSAATEQGFGGPPTGERRTGGIGEERSA